MKTKFFFLGLLCAILAGCQNSDNLPDHFEVLLSPMDSAAIAQYAEQGGLLLGSASLVLRLKPSPADTIISAEGGEVTIRVVNDSDYNLDYSPDIYVPEDVSDKQCVSLIDSKNISSKEIEFRFKISANEGNERAMDICFFSEKFMLQNRYKYLAGFTHLRQLSK